MKIVILGATGKTGQQLVVQALEQGYAVTAFVRDESKIGIKKPNLTIRVGDARNQADLQAVLSGKDAVINVLGSHKLKDDLMAKSTEALIRAMHAVGMRRVIMLSSFLMTEHQKPGLLMKAVGNMSKNVIKDKSASESQLKASGLDWTLVYATRLKRGPLTGNVRVIDSAEAVRLQNGINRADVADYMLELLDNESMYGESVLITTK